MSEYVAIINNERQIASDEWETYKAVMKLTDETTVGQIKEWFVSHRKPPSEWVGDHWKQGDKSLIKMNGLQISEL